MKTKNRLNCYLFSNLIISILSLNFLVSDNSRSLVAITNDNTLNKIYEIQNTSSFNNNSNNITTVSVSIKTVQSKNTFNYIKPSYNSITGANLVSYAKHYLGLPYISGGYSLETGTDCSGFTKLIYQEFGITIGRTVKSQLYSGTYVSKEDLMPGDLVFYGYTNYATHVGIYIGDGLVIHESNPRDGVKINSVNMMVYQTARRLITSSVEVEDVKTDSQDESINLELESDKEQTNEVSNDILENNQEVQEEVNQDIILDNDNIQTEIIDEPTQQESTQIEEDDEVLNSSEEVINQEIEDNSDLTNELP